MSFRKVAGWTVAITIGFVVLMNNVGQNLEAEFVRQGHAEMSVSPVPASDPSVSLSKEPASAPAKPVRMKDLPPQDDADRAIGAAINLNGHLCARPIMVQEVATQMYAVRCITRRDGTGMSDYLVNSRTSEVEAI